MVTLGVDLGAKFVKVVALKDGKVAARTKEPTGFDQKESASKAIAAALKQAGVAREDVKVLVTTGLGRKSIPGAAGAVTEVTAVARGIRHAAPSVRTVIDIGAEEGRAVRCGDDGKVIDFVVNEKCAAGAGAFTEAMARALEITVQEMGPLSLKSTRAVPMNAQCAVFAESEVVSLIHQKTSKEDIARAVHDAIASRLISMVRRIGVERDVALVGGVAYNTGLHDSLKRGLDIDVMVPEHPEYMGALGAALIAQEKGKQP